MKLIFNECYKRESRSRLPIEPVPTRFRLRISQISGFLKFRVGSGKDFLFGLVGSGRTDEKSESYFPFRLKISILALFGQN